MNFPDGNMSSGMPGNVANARSASVCGAPMAVPLPVASHRWMRQSVAYARRRGCTNSMASGRRPSGDHTTSAHDRP